MSSSALRVLWLAGDVPVAAATGLQSYSRGLTRALAGAGADVLGVGLAAGAETGAGGAAVDVVDEGVRWTPVAAARRPTLRNLVSRWPNLASACAVAPLRDEVDRRLTEGRWDAVVVDHLQRAWVWDRVAQWRRERSPATRLVFVTHNCEAGVRRDIARQASGSPARRAVLRYDAAKAAALEKRAATEADVVTAITAEDAAAFRPLRPGGDVLVLTPGYEGVVVDRPLDAGVGRRAIVLGSFEWHVKLENLRRIVRSADPIFARGGVELVVAGRVPDGPRQELAAGLAATRFSGFVPSVSEALAEARIGIVSEPAGGGFKMKVLDYVFHGLVVAHLRGSVAGMPLEPGVDTIVADDEETLAAAIVVAIDDLERLDAMQRRARERCAAAFRWSDRGEQLAAAIAP